MQRIRNHGIDPCEQSTPLDLALHLRTRSVHHRELLERLLGEAGRDHDCALIVFVAIAPELNRVMARMSCRVDERLSDLLLSLWELVMTVEHVPCGRRLTVLLESVPRVARSMSRGNFRHNPATTPLPDDFDVAEAASDDHLIEQRTESLNLALLEGVVSLDEYALMHATRGHILSLADAAINYDLSYEAVQKRRRRAESRLATYITQQGEA
jgi:hypothetical protein